MEWERELHRREMLGITNPPPHPDQVKINMNTGLAYIGGPATKDQVGEIEMWRDRQRMFEEELDTTLKALKRARKPARITNLQEEKEQAEQVLEIIGSLLGKTEWKNW